jgi:membrane fusion protein, multidrug efflux system
MELKTCTPIFFLFFLFACKGGSNTEEKKSDSDFLQVNYVIANHKTINQIINIPGTVLPFESVSLFSEISGRVKKIQFQEGQIVTKGSTIIQIDTDILEAQRKQLQVDFDLASKDEERKKNLLVSKAISLEEYEIVQSKLNNISAQIDLLKVQISKGTITAPFTGKIGLRQISEGAYITPATLIATIAQNDKVKIEFSVAERYANKVRKGQTIQFRKNNEIQYKTATIYAFEPTIELETRMLRVRAEMNADSDVFPGSFAQIAYDLGEEDNCIMIPTSALVPVMKGQKIWIIKNGKAKDIPVELGLRTDTEIQVIGEVNEGDTVITTGLLGLRIGMNVKAK